MCQTAHTRWDGHSEQPMIQFVYINDGTYESNTIWKCGVADGRSRTVHPQSVGRRRTARPIQRL